MPTATLQAASKPVDQVTPIRHPLAHELPFDQIMRRYGGMVYNTCLGITRNAHDAEDATQATFLTLAMHLQSEKTIKYLGPWLEQVARRVALNLIRSRKRRDRRENVVAEMQKPETIDVDKVDADEVRSAVREELNQIPPRYRMPLILHYFGESSTEDIARELGVTPNALCVRLHRGRQMLRERLSKRGITISAIGLGIVLAQMVRIAIYEQLANPVTQTAAALAAGHAVVPPAVGTHVVAMAQGAMKPVLGGRIKLAALLIILSAGTLTGASRLAALGNTLKPSNLLNNSVETIRNALPNPLDLRVERTPAQRPPAPAPIYVAPQPPVTEVAINGTPMPTAPLAGARRGPGAFHPLLPPVGAPAGARLPVASFSPEASAPLAAWVQDPTFVIPTPGVSQPVMPGSNRAFRSQDRDLSYPQLAMGPATPPFDGGIVDTPDFGTIDGSVPVDGGMPPGAALVGSIQLSTDQDAYQWPRDSFPAVASRQRIDFRFHGLETDGPLVIEPLPRSQFDEMELPEGHSFISIWAMATGAEFESVDLMVHYDEDLVEQMGLIEKNLKLWMFDGEWHRIDDGLNMDLNTIWGDTTRGHYIAISTPEPGTMAVGAIAAGYALLRRRRRASAA